jgi:hypothetical protein
MPKIIEIAVPVEEIEARRSRDRRTFRLPESGILCTIVP